MIELAKHIEILLLENDCVIVPGLGGFIAHYRSASINETNGKFCPPSRTIGFNPRLIMNDGLLVQSYMQAYNTDFPDATRKIEKVVSQIKEDIYQQGHIHLNNIGILYYNINASYEFEPTPNSFFTPHLYGLESIFLPLLSADSDRLIADFNPIPVLPQKSESCPSSVIVPMRHRKWIQYIATTAAAILLFFLFSVPVENTYIDDAEYASLGSASLFDAIRSRSANSHLTLSKWQNDSIYQQDQSKKRNANKQIQNNINTLKPVRIKTEKVETVTSNDKKESIVNANIQKKTTKEKSRGISKNETEKGVYIIIASLPNATSANQEINKLKQKGYKKVQLIHSQGRYRIAFAKYANQTDAYKELQEVKKKEEFASAWIFISK